VIKIFEKNGKHGKWGKFYLVSGLIFFTYGFLINLLYSFGLEFYQNFIYFSIASLIFATLFTYILPKILLFFQNILYKRMSSIGELKKRLVISFSPTVIVSLIIIPFMVYYSIFAFLDLDMKQFSDSKVTDTSLHESWHVLSMLISFLLFFILEYKSLKSSKSRIRWSGVKIFILIILTIISMKLLLSLALNLLVFAIRGVLA